VTFSRIFRAIVVLLLVTILTSCSTSKFILGPLYNRLDDQMRDEFNKLGRFTDEQKDQFEARLQTFHIWHRKQELPRYADLLNVIQRSVSAPNRTTAVDIKQWFDSVERLSVSARVCHPVNYSYELMKTLTDEQVDFIERRFEREQGKNQKRYRSRTQEERLARRFKNINKWSGRIGLRLTDEQKTLLRATLAKQISLREKYWVLSAEWNRAFFVIGRDQDASDYDARMDAHLAKLWSLLESNHQTQWQANRELWRGFALEFTASMTTGQREWARGWLGKLATTLRSMSDENVNFSPDASLGCT